MPRAFELKRELGSLAVMCAGALIAGFAVNLFYIPTLLTMGGISGVASVIFHLSQERLSLGLLTLLFNLPIFVLGHFFVSRAFILRSLVGTLTFSFSLDLTRSLGARLFVPLLLGGDPNGKVDLFLCAVLGGVIFGIGLGLIMLARYTTGGTDILAVILHKKVSSLSIGMGIWLIDAFVITFSAIAYRSSTPNSLNMALYSTISLFISAKAVDLVSEGFNYKRTAIIISEHADAIARRVMEDLDRGITGLHGRGMYTRRDKTVLLCVLSKTQIREARRIVAEEDPKAFFFVMDTREVLGEGFEQGGGF